MFYRRARRHEDERRAPTTKEDWIAEASEFAAKLQTGYASKDDIETFCRRSPRARNAWRYVSRLRGIGHG